MSVASPSRAAFPLSQEGRRPRLHFRGLLRLHSNYGPLDRSTAQGGLCHRASIHPVTRTNRLPATRSNQQLSGWILPPLVIRAFWAHWDMRVSGPAARGLFPGRFMAVLEATKAPFQQVIHSFLAPRLTAPGLALIGDAAHLCRPHVASGSSLAIQDAVALARVVGAAGGSGETALGAFEAERLPLASPWSACRSAWGRRTRGGRSIGTARTKRGPRAGGRP